MLTMLDWSTSILFIYRQFLGNFSGPGDVGAQNQCLGLGAEGPGRKSCGLINITDSTIRPLHTHHNRRETEPFPVYQPFPTCIYKDIRCWWRRIYAALQNKTSRFRLFFFLACALHAKPGDSILLSQMQGWQTAGEFRLLSVIHKCTLSVVMRT